MEPKTEQPSQPPCPQPGCAGTLSEVRSERAPGLVEVTRLCTTCGHAAADETWVARAAAAKAASSTTPPPRE